MQGKNQFDHVQYTGDHTGSSVLPIGQMVKQGWSIIQDLKKTTSKLIHILYAIYAPKLI